LAARVIECKSTKIKIGELVLPPDLPTADLLDRTVAVFARAAVVLNFAANFCSYTLLAGARFVHFAANTLLFVCSATAAR
jgi:hypothetical protein